MTNCDFLFETTDYTSYQLVGIPFGTKLPAFWIKIFPVRLVFLA